MGRKINRLKKQFTSLEGREIIDYHKYDYLCNDFLNQIEYKGPRLKNNLYATSILIGRLAKDKRFNILNIIENIPDWYTRENKKGFGHIIRIVKPWVKDYVYEGISDKCNETKFVRSFIQLFNLGVPINLISLSSSYTYNEIWERCKYWKMYNFDYPVVSYLRNNEICNNEEARNLLLCQGKNWWKKADGVGEYTAARTEILLGIKFED